LRFAVGSNSRLGADGMGFWFVEQKPLGFGPVLGMETKWSGLGILFDQFDNDQSVRKKYIYIFYLVVL